MYKTVHGLVLREVKFKEADKMLTVLTQEEGKLSVRARGALRKSCRFAAASQQFAYSEMTLFLNRGRYYMEEASVVEDFRGLRDKFEALALAAYFAELLEAVSDEDSPDPELLRLGLNALFALSHEMFTEKQIKAAFELRVMCISGYAPALDYCAGCGKTENFRPVFSIGSGELFCSDCGEKAADGGLYIGAQTLAAMRYITGADPKRAFSFKLDEKDLRELGRVCQRYALRQLDRGFGALDYYEKLN